MPKITQRRNMTPEELKEHNKNYYKAYYAKKKNTDTFKNQKKPKTGLNIINNNINRIMRDDEFILLFIEKIGNDKLLGLMGYELNE